MTTSYEARIISITKEADTVYTFVLERAADLQFHPGQYVWVSLEGYSKSPMAIASGTNEEHLILSVRKWGELTTALFELNVGDHINIEGAYGTYFPRNELDKGNPLFMIAGGTGITPIRSLINSVTNLDQLHLLYGAQESKQLLFLQELKSEDLKFNYTIDKPEDGWQGQVGFVTELLMQIPLPKNSQFFICGPFPMLKSVVEYLISQKVNANDIFLSIEKFDKDGNVVGPVLTLNNPDSGLSN